MSYNILYIQTLCNIYAIRKNVNRDWKMLNTMSINSEHLVFYVTLEAADRISLIFYVTIKKSCKTSHY